MAVIFLNSEHLERLKPFVHRKSSRQRVMLYLLGCGYTVPELVNMALSELGEIDFPDEIAGYRDELVETAESKVAFCYSNGKPMAHHDFYTLLRRASLRATGSPLGQVAFRQYIQA